MLQKKKKKKGLVRRELKLFLTTVANADTESLQSFHTLFETYLDHMLIKFKSNRIVRKVQNLELKLDKKKKFFKTIFDESLTMLTPFCKAFLQRKHLFKLFSFQTTIFQCSKIIVVRYV